MMTEAELGLHTVQLKCLWATLRGGTRKASAQVFGRIAEVARDADFAGQKPDLKMAANGREEYGEDGA